MLSALLSTYYRQTLLRSFCALSHLFLIAALCRVDTIFPILIAEKTESQRA